MVLFNNGSKKVLLKQLQGENGQTLKVNETRKNYDAAVHGYTFCVTKPFFIC